MLGFLRPRIPVQQDGIRGHVYFRASLRVGVIVHEWLAKRGSSSFGGCERVSCDAGGGVSQEDGSTRVLCFVDPIADD
eukprot:scaffold1771_cov343-Pavlova_lutheri.AAC.4